MTDSVAKVLPKGHLVYYALASLNVLVIMAGLLMSHRIIQAYEGGLEATAAYDRQLVSLRTISETATDANASVVDSLRSRMVDSARANFRSKALEMRKELARLKASLAPTLGGNLKARFDGIVARLDTSMTGMELHAMTTFALLAEGRQDEALAEVGRMQSRYASLRRSTKDLTQLGALIRTAKAEQERQSLGMLRKYELAIGGMIALIIGSVLLYGHYISRLLKQKYRELGDALSRSRAAEAEARAFSSQIQSVNEDVVRLNRELESNLTKLRDAQDELVRKGRLSQLGQLTATVAHELRNPLGTVRTSAFLMERKLKDKGLGVETQLQRINNGVTRCDSIISQLLDFARTKQLQCDSLVLDDWVAKLTEDEAQSLPEAVAVECHLGTDGIKADFDPARMSRVLINLLSNASEAMVGKGDDPAKFTVGAPRIVVRTRVTPRGVELSVSDNGPGIPPTVMPRILEPLFTTKNFGTGLGLPAVEKIMEQHGGGIEIASHEGQGATFTVWWPLKTRGEVAA
jgi:signal transduction histidine kinase